MFCGILNAGLSGTGLAPAEVASALRPVFVVAVLVGVVSTVVALRLPERPLRERTAFEEAEETPAASPGGPLLAEA